jgi:hypothetical protein
MFKLKELMHIILAIILFAFVIWFFRDESFILPSFIVASVVILTNVIAKKVAARYFQTKVEMKTWEFQRWGYYQRSQFKKPKPIGIVLPFLVAFASTGLIKMLTFLQTEISPTLRRVTKRRGGVRRYTELTEWHYGYIPSIGMFLNLSLVFIPLLMLKNSLTIEIARYGIYYCIWNIIPVGKLDGSKIIMIGLKWWLFVWFWVIVALGLFAFL